MRSLSSHLKTTDNTIEATTDYRVELELYSGPLDLLLYLVRRHEVDVVDLPIAKITAQFVEFLEVLDLIDFDVAGDFIVMASTLVEIKSRLVLPGSQEPAPEVDVTEDPCSELVHQLLQYKKFKDAARTLEDRASEWQLRYPRQSNERPTQGKSPSDDHIKEVELWDLVSALTRILRRIDPAEQKTIVYDDTPISVYMERITARVKIEDRVAFTTFFEGATSKSGVVGIFLAILELLRNFHYRADQPDRFGEIWVLAPLSQTAEEPGSDLDETGTASGPDVSPDTGQPPSE